jgi:hypothetical protein
MVRFSEILSSKREKQLPYLVYGVLRDAGLLGKGLARLYLLTKTIG